MPALDFHHYVPILKGRLGEFTALDRAGNERHSLTPLLEVTPGSVELGEDGEPDPATVSEDIDRFIKRASKWTGPMMVDTGQLPAAPGQVPMYELLRELAFRGSNARPVVRPSDSEEVLATIGSAVSEFAVGAATIRLAGEDLDDTDEPLEVLIARTLRFLGLEPPEVDVILDLGEVGSEQAATFGARIVRLTLTELPYVDDWRILAVAAGAFPTDLTAVQPGVLTPIPRYDAQTWRAVRSRFPGRTPSFSDYAIAHPVMPAGAGFAPAPQLRYTASDDWLVMKGRKADRKGAMQFFDICRTIVAHPEFTRGDSWGDDRIGVVENGKSDLALKENPGTGNAMTWRAIGTSHHMALMVNRLANLGEP